MQGTSLGDSPPKRKIGAGLIALLVVGGLVLLAGSVAAGYFLLRPSKGDEADRYTTLPDCSRYETGLTIPVTTSGRSVALSPTRTLLSCDWSIHEDGGSVLSAEFMLHKSPDGDSGAGRRAALETYQVKIGDNAMPLAKADRAQTHSAPQLPDYCELDMLQGNVTVIIGGTMAGPCDKVATTLATSISNTLG